MPAPSPIRLSIPKTPRRSARPSAERKGRPKNHATGVASANCPKRPAGVSPKGLMRTAMASPASASAAATGRNRLPAASVESPSVAADSAASASAGSPPTSWSSAGEDAASGRAPSAAGAASATSRYGPAPATARAISSRIPVPAAPVPACPARADPLPPFPSAGDSVTARSPVTRLTETASTPGTRSTAFSIPLTQPAQCIPSTRASSRAPPAGAGEVSGLTAPRAAGRPARPASPPAG